MRVSVVLASCALLAACASQKQLYLPDGRQGFAISCGGNQMGWNHCYRKAGDTCGARGYTIIEQRGEDRGQVMGNQYGVIGGTVAGRSMVIACK